MNVIGAKVYICSRVSRSLSDKSPSINTDRSGSHRSHDSFIIVTGSCDTVARTSCRRSISSALPLIVLGHVYLLAPAVNTTPNGIGPTISTPIPNVYQLSGPLPEATTQIGYTYIAGIGAYKFHTQAADWYTARLICREEGGSLAVINSQAESEAIAQLFTMAGIHLDSTDAEYAWLGFHDLFGGKGRYETVHNEYLENVGFNQWKNGKRGGFGPYCGNMFKSGLLGSNSCGRYHAFVCELPEINTYVKQRKTDTLTVS